MIVLGGSDVVGGLGAILLIVTGVIDGCGQLHRFPGDYGGLGDLHIERIGPGRREVRGADDFRRVQEGGEIAG